MRNRFVHVLLLSAVLVGGCARRSDRINFISEVWKPFLNIPIGLCEAYGSDRHGRTRVEFELSGRQTETRERNPKARLTLDPCHRRVGAALALAGIGTSQLHPLGFADQETVLNLVALTESLVNKPLELQPAIVITQPYEGGHPDHDSTAFAVHTACEILLKEQGVAPIIVEATSYFNRAGIMATSEFLPRARSDIKTFALAEAERAFKRRLFACFRTQQNVLQYFPLAIERFRASFDFTAPPHPGKLYYKLFKWGTTGERWRKLAGAALRRLNSETELLTRAGNDSEVLA